MASTHSHGKATGTATTTKPAAAGSIDGDLAALSAKVTSLSVRLASNEALVDDHEARIAELENANPDPVPPDPVPTPPTTVTVNSIAELYAALANNEPDITLAPGTYSGGYYFDSRFAGRTKPGIVRLDGTTMNGGGLTFRGGAHDLEVIGPTFANWSLNQTGVLMFGGWDEPGAHHLTVRKAKILSSVKRTLLGNTSEHGAYFSHSRGGCHDILIEDFDVDASAADGLASGVHMDHADNGLVNAYNVTVRRLVYKGNGTQGSSVQQAIILWTPPVHDWTFDGATITNANGYAVRFESKGAANIRFQGVVSTGSRARGFYSSMGANPPGVVFGPGNSFG